MIKQLVDINSTKCYQKPHTVDVISLPVSKYEKPNAYDEEPPVVITASRQGSRSSRKTVNSYSSRYFTIKESSSPSPIDIINDTTIGNCYSPNTPIESPPPSIKSPIITKIDNAASDSQQNEHKHITSFILRQPVPTTQTSLGHHNEIQQDTLPSYYAIPSSPANSIASNDSESAMDRTVTSTNGNVAAATAALFSNDSDIISSFFLASKSKKHLPNTDTSFYKSSLVTYTFKKASLEEQDQHFIYIHQQNEDDRDIMVYRKIQFRSCSWGMQSALYFNRDDAQGVKVAEAKRGAFQRQISIETADYVNSEIENISQTRIKNIKNLPATGDIHCQKLIKRSRSNMLFEYEMWFHGSRMRWKRPSLLSHDFTCEVKLTRQETKFVSSNQQMDSSGTTTKKKRNSKGKKVKSKISGHAVWVKEGEFIDSDSDNEDDDHDNHTHKTCRRWKLLAEFHNHNMSYSNIEMGKLSIDLDILSKVETERCDLLEANVVMTCSTLIDLTREAMGKHY